MSGPFPKLFNCLWLGFAAPLLASGLDNPPVVWTNRLGTLSDSSPAVAPGGTIYVGAFDGKLWAINSNGAVKWNFQTGLEIKSSPAVAADGTIYFGSRDRKFYALTSGGREKWHFKTGGWVDSSPAIGRDGTVYFGSWDKSFYALNPDGSRKWRVETGGVIDSSPGIGLDGTIYFGSHDEFFYALAADGAVKWKFKTGGAILSSPAVDSEKSVCFTSVDGYCYNLNFDGSLRWKVRTAGITASSPVFAADGSVYVAANEELWILSPNGQNQSDWFRLEAPMDSTALAFADGNLGILGGWGNFMKFQLHPPDFEWRMADFVQSSGSPGIGPDATIYLPGVIALRGGVPLAKSSWPKFRGNARNTGNAADNVATAVESKRVNQVK